MGLEVDKEHIINQITDYSKPLPISIMTYWLVQLVSLSSEKLGSYMYSDPQILLFYCILHCIAIFNMLGSLGSSLI